MAWEQGLNCSEVKSREGSPCKSNSRCRDAGAGPSQRSGEDREGGWDYRRGGGEQDRPKRGQGPDDTRNRRGTGSLRHRETRDGKTLPHF